MNTFQLDGVSQLQFFHGHCQYGSDPTNYTDASNDHECYEQCKNTDGCNAFAYEYGNKEYEYGNYGNNCNLYDGGPYTKGNGSANTKCYIMDIGNWS